jgi:hypothetical protein
MSTQSFTVVCESGPYRDVQRKGTEREAFHLASYSARLYAAHGIDRLISVYNPNGKFLGGWDVEGGIPLGVDENGKVEPL